MTAQAVYLNPFVRILYYIKTHIIEEWGKIRGSIKLIQFYSKGYNRNLIVLMILCILVGLMETFQIVLLYPILNASFNLQDQEITFFEPLYTLVRDITQLPDVVAFCMLFVLLVILTFLITLIYKYLSLRFTKSIMVKTKKSIFDKLATNDYRFFVDNRRGDIMYSAIFAPSKIRSFLETLTVIFSDIATVLTVFVVLFLISTTGVALMLLGGFLFILVIRFIGKRFAYSLGKRQLKSVRSENEIINGYVQGLRQIRSVNGDGYWKEKYNNALFNYYDKFVKYSFFQHLPSVALNSLFFLIIGVVVISLYYLYLDRFMFVIPLIGTFAFAALKVLPRISSIGNNYLLAINDWPNLQNVYRFLNDTRYNTLINGAKKFQTLNSDITFDNVYFSYYKSQKMIEGVNLTIRKNKITALVGQSGSGKSTLISLLLRYYDVNGGSILINGIDLREYDLKTYLGKIGYVSQDTFIFNATVRENIAFGGNYSDDCIVKAAIKANIHSFITSLPNGYDSLVGDQGLKLSGGEKQRIAIARALVRDPEILVLDEATSNLDNRSEAIVQESINRASENITTFIIAHRLSTIRNADTIFVIGGGKIIESGTHKELIEKQGTYFELNKSNP